MISAATVQRLMAGEIVVRASYTDDDKRLFTTESARRRLPSDICREILSDMPDSEVIFKTNRNEMIDTCMNKLAER